MSVHTGNKHRDLASPHGEPLLQLFKHLSARRRRQAWLLLVFMLIGAVAEVASSGIAVVRWIEQRLTNDTLPRQQVGSTVCNHEIFAVANDPTLLSRKQWIVAVDR